MNSILTLFIWLLLCDKGVRFRFVFLQEQSLVPVESMRKLSIEYEEESAKE